VQVRNTGKQYTIEVCTMYIERVKDEKTNYELPVKGDQVSKDKARGMQRVFQQKFLFNFQREAKEKMKKEKDSGCLS